MSSTPRRGIGDLVASTAGLLILLFAIIAVDARFRVQVANTAEVADLAQQVSHLAMVIAMVVVQFTREQIFEHVHLAVLTIVAVVLVVFLVRL